MEQYSIDITEHALRDVREIYSYIAHDLKEPLTALGQIDRIESAIDSLAVMPRRAPLISDGHLASEGYRKLIVDHYIVFFTIDEAASAVRISRILYARRDWVSII